MILEHTFDEEAHLYKVDGQFVLSTSDVITLNGLNNFDAVPKQVLEHASWRGTELHRAIQFFEEDAEVPDMPDEVVPYFEGYLKFKIAYEFDPIGEMEKQIVYVHEGTEQAVGCTIDLRGLVKGQPYILDAKTTAKMYGKALSSKCLAWRLQLASYSEATSEDIGWWSMGAEQMPQVAAGKGIVQVNREGGYTFHDFSQTDDSHLWDSAVRMAVAKLSAGFQIDRR